MRHRETIFLRPREICGGMGRGERPWATLGPLVRGRSINVGLCIVPMMRTAVGADRAPGVSRSGQSTRTELPRFLHVRRRQQRSGNRQVHVATGISTSVVLGPPRAAGGARGQWRGLGLPQAVPCSGAYATALYARLLYNMYHRAGAPGFGPPTAPPCDQEGAEVARLWRGWRRRRKTMAMAARWCW